MAMILVCLWSLLVLLLGVLGRAHSDSSLWSSALSVPLPFPFVFFPSPLSTAAQTSIPFARRPPFSPSPFPFLSFSAMPVRVLYSVEISERPHLRVTLDSREQPITFARLVAALRFGRQQLGQTPQPPHSADPVFQIVEDRETISFSSERELREVLQAAKRMQQTEAEGQTATGSAPQHAGAHDDDDDGIEIVPLHIRVLQATNQTQVRSPFDRTAKRSRRGQREGDKGSNRRRGDSYPPALPHAARIRIQLAAAPPGQPLFLHHTLSHSSFDLFGCRTNESELEPFDSAL